MSRLLNRIARRPAQPGEEPTSEAPREPGLLGVAERGRARRRLRYLRRVRELQLRDLGGFVLDLYRFGEQRDRLVREKLDGVIATDKETHALEALLGETRPAHERAFEVRAPGVGGTCPACGDFHASDARFCSRCGIDLAAVPRPEELTFPTEATTVADEPLPAQEAAPVAADADALAGDTAAAEEEAPAADPVAVEESSGDITVAPLPASSDPAEAGEGDWPEGNGAVEDTVQVAAGRRRAKS